jgi:effector-binding domain-containing protein
MKDSVIVEQVGVARLSEAYSAIQNWSKESGRQFAGPFWELYGHCNDDPAKVRTDIYYLLR